MLTVVAKMVAQNGSAEALKAELLKLLTPTRKEEGCIEYRLHQDNDDPSVFLFYENWESRSHLDRHMESAHFKAYISAVKELVADKAVHLMTAVE